MVSRVDARASRRDATPRSRQNAPTSRGVASGSRTNTQKERRPSASPGRRHGINGAAPRTRTCVCRTTLNALRPRPEPRPRQEPRRRSPRTCPASARVGTQGGERIRKVQSALAARSSGATVRKPAPRSRRVTTAQRATLCTGAISLAAHRAAGTSSQIATQRGRNHGARGISTLGSCRRIAQRHVAPVESIQFTNSTPTD